MRDSPLKQREVGSTLVKLIFPRCSEVTASVSLLWLKLAQGQRGEETLGVTERWE